MANPLRGEASIDLPGGRTYRLRFTWNAAAEFEASSSQTISDALTLLAESKLSARSLRAMLWAGLREHHASVDLQGAGALLDEIGRVRAMDLLGVAMRYYFPEMESAESGSDPPPPAPSA